MIEIIRAHILPAAYRLLPPEMESEAATAMLIAIGWQESRFVHRKQISGPAKGFWQFERGGGVAGVLSHPSTRDHVRDAMDALKYPFSPTPHWAHTTLTDNDILAAVFARLLLWTVPHALPDRQSPNDGWHQYISGWRPGRPHPETWAEAWVEGWRGR